MFRKRLLIVSATSFYGGGESFVVNTLTKLSSEYDLYYIVQNDYLYSLLLKENANVFYFKKGGLMQILMDVQHVIDNISPDITILNGGRSIYMTPFLKRTKKNYLSSYNKQLCVII